MDLPSRNIPWRIVALIIGGIFIYAGVLKAMREEAGLKRFLFCKEPGKNG